MTDNDATLPANTPTPPTTAAPPPTASPQNPNPAANPAIQPNTTDASDAATHNADDTTEDATDE